MSDPNSIRNVEGMSAADRTGDVERVDELTSAWESSPLTDPIEARDPAAGPLAGHGDQERGDPQATPRPGTDRISDRRG